MKTIIPLVFLALLFSCNSPKKKKDTQIIEVNYVENAPIIDGLAIEYFWNLIEWHSLDQNWKGELYGENDFNGRYKLAWNQEALYILVEIKDDSLFNRSQDPLKLWWNDDSVRVFVDEDNSGGLHQYSHNAFAYHVGLDGNVVDLGLDKKPKLYNENVRSSRTTKGNLSTWEVAVKIFDDSYQDDTINNPVKLTSNKKLGFALAYYDKDQSMEQENFIGSVYVSNEKRNQEWINADIFGTLVLKK
ncbi:sugar-binding protein [Maribacter sp. 2210JD10-5]|uniref:sugar-binding protein n=1 Tax=Maribacter sp. 2210JD10-5 TaxID=3386272 RepID=UPI0039BC3A8D